MAAQRHMQGRGGSRRQNACLVEPTDTGINVTSTPLSLGPGSFNEMLDVLQCEESRSRPTTSYRIQ